jgi:hypothetical protein
VPLLGDVKLCELGPDSLDALYARLRRCSRLTGPVMVSRQAGQPNTLAASRRTWSRPMAIGGIDDRPWRRRWRRWPSLIRRRRWPS